MKQFSKVKLKNMKDQFKLQKGGSPLELPKTNLSWKSFQEKYDNVDIFIGGKSSNNFEKIFKDTSFLNNKAFIWGIFIATGLFGLFPNECLAVSDATLKAKWDSSGIQKLLTKDARTIAAIIAAGVGGIMVMMPANRQPKSDFIWGTCGAIIGSGFLVEWVTAGKSILV